MNNLTRRDISRLRKALRRDDGDPFCSVVDRLSREGKIPMRLLPFANDPACIPILRAMGKGYRMYPYRYDRFSIAYNRFKCFIMRLDGLMRTCMVSLPAKALRPLTTIPYLRRLFMSCKKCL